jgi:hypothetical protein
MKTYGLTGGAGHWGDATGQRTKSIERFAALGFRKNGKTRNPAGNIPTDPEWLGFGGRAFPFSKNETAWGRTSAGRAFPHAQKCTFQKANSLH